MPKKIWTWYGLDIRSTPTTVVLDKSGVEVGRAVGAPKRAEVLATLSAIK